MSPATRPARPGDILADARTEGGIGWYVEVRTPPDHAESGSVAPTAIVSLRGRIALPAEWSSHYLAPAWRDKLAKVLDCSLDRLWGEWVPLQDLLTSEGHRVMDHYWEGLSIAVGLAELRSQLATEYGKALAVFSAHSASVEAHLAAVAAAYAAWPVPVVEPS